MKQENQIAQAIDKRSINISSSLSTALIYPWVVWALSSIFLFYKYLLQVSPSVMVPDLMRTFSLTGTSLGNLAAFYFYAYLAMQLPVGLLLDRYSPKRLVAAAIALCATGGLLFAIAPYLGIAYLGRLLIGIGGAFSAVGTMKLITLWFPPKRFALVSGLMMTVGMLGAVCGEAPLSYAVQVFDWRHATLLISAAGFILSVAFLFVVKELRKDSNNQHEEIKQPFFAALRTIINKPQSWLISFYSGLAFAPVSAFAGFWGVPYLVKAYGINSTEIAGLVSLTFIGFAIGSPLAGWFSDRIKRRKPMMAIGTSAALILLLVILYVHLSSDLLGSALFLFGFFEGWFFVSFATMREINDPRGAGTAIGSINMLNAIFGALSEPMIGKFLDLGWKGKVFNGVRIFPINDYRYSLLTLPIFLLIALILLIFVKETYCGRQELSVERGKVV